MKKVFYKFFALLIVIPNVTNFRGQEIPNVSFSDKSLSDEGFLWKRSLVVSKEGAEFSYEETHQELYNEIKSFQEELKNLPDELIKLISGVFSNDTHKTSLKEIFLNLSHNKKVIKDLKIDESRIEEIFDSDGSLEKMLEDEDVKTILKNNLTRLKSRNACIASFEYVDGDGRITKFPIQSKDNKPIIFLSGIGNELIRILQQDQLFNKWEFIVFHKEKTNENSIQIEGLSNSLNNLYNKSDAPSLTNKFKATVQLLPTAQKAKEELLKQINSQAKTFLDEPNINETLKNNILSISNKLIETKKDYDQKYKEFRKKFCDSEQALRYYLFAHIKTILENQSITDKGLLFLNIHSQLDPCLRCTNALALECFLRNQDKFPEATKSSTKGQKNFDETLGGFFHKLYNIDSKNMPQTFILVSSQEPESESGLTRRLLSGKSYDSQVNEKISSDSEIRLFFRYNGPENL